MSSNIPTRRTTRATRTATRQASENANSRSSQIVTRSRSKSVAVNNIPVENLNARATAPTIASRAKANEKVENATVKRKREALVEVTKLMTNNKKNGKSNAGKGKEKDDKGTKETQQPKPTVRQPLRPTVSDKITTRRSEKGDASNAVSSRPLLPELKEEVASAVVEEETLADQVMPVDHQPIILPKRSPVFTRMPEQPKEPVASSTVTAVPKAGPVQEVGDDPESSRVSKRRHTSKDESIPLQDESQAEADDVAAQLAVHGEALPDNDLWDDLDAEDWDDPAMVSEYVADVFKYLKEAEITTLPNPNYVDLQTELDWSKRGILVDWLIQVHAHFHLLSESLFLCINIIDRFLSARLISISRLQLVGLTALLIASKFEETMVPSVQDLAKLSEGLYSVADILKAEQFILKVIEWDMTYPNPMGFLRRVSRADNLEVQARTVGKYLMEIGCVERRLIATPPSLLAAAAMWLGRLVLGREDWNYNLAHYSSYSESEIIPTANVMLNYVLKSVPPHPALYQKYAAKRHLKASVYMRQWALSRWEEGARVALVEDLPALKADIREMRAAGGYVAGEVYPNPFAVADGYGYDDTDLPGQGGEDKENMV